MAKRLKKSMQLRAGETPYAVTIMVVNLETGDCPTYREHVGAKSKSQAIRRAGMKIVQMLKKKE
jgi:hypothetical protein